MTENVEAPTPPKKTNTGLIVAIVALLFLCCCCIALVALYFGYDALGDPLGIYGLLPQARGLVA